MKIIIYIFGLLFVVACGRSDVLSLTDLITKSKTELTSKQWNMKMALCRVCLEDIIVKNDEFILTLTEKEFEDKGLPPLYYAEMKKSLKDVNDYITDMRQKNPDMILNLDSLDEVAKKNLIDVYPECIE